MLSSSALSHNGVFSHEKVAQQVALDSVEILVKAIIQARHIC